MDKIALHGRVLHILPSNPMQGQSVSVKEASSTPRTDATSTYGIKKAQKRKAEASRTFNWSSLYLNVSIPHSANSVRHRLMAMVHTIEQCCPRKRGRSIWGRQSRYTPTTVQFSCSAACLGGNPPYSGDERLPRKRDSLLLLFVSYRSLRLAFAYTERHRLGEVRKSRYSSWIVRKDCLDQEFTV